jgi:hypothetical protein
MIRPTNISLTNVSSRICISELAKLSSEIHHEIQKTRTTPKHLA